MIEEVKSFLREEIERKHVPGAVIQIAQDSELLFEEAFGYKQVHPEKERMDLETVFDLASLTKVVATLPAILKLMDEGEIRLDDYVQHFLPEFSQNGKEDITVRHLLTHTSGLRSFKPFYVKNLKVEKILAEIYADKQEAPIGSKVTYSDLGLITLYKVVEVVTGEEFSSFLDREFFSPLGMTETGFNPKFSVDRYAATEFCEQRQEYKRGIVHDENCEAMGGVSGHAGLFSTVEDLGKFAEMVEQDGIYKGRKLLSEHSLTLARENFTPWDSSDYRGLGWQVKGPAFSSCGDYFSSKSYGHTGFTGTSLWIDPEVNLRVILLTNRVHYGRRPHIIRLRPRLHNIIRKYF